MAKITLTTGERITVHETQEDVARMIYKSYRSDQFVELHRIHANEINKVHISYRNIIMIEE